MSTWPLPVVSAEPSERAIPASFACAIGFFFVFRTCLSFLFFQSDPVLGTIVNIAFGLALLFGAVLYATEDRARIRLPLLQISPIRWILALLTLSFASLLWTGAQSVSAALAYWAGMVADVAIVLLLLWHGEAERRAQGLMIGAVWGAVALALVAWCSPATADLRLGDDVFLHPNTLGLEIGLGALVAQYLIPRAAHWKWVAIALAITLLRTLSKTAIIAFIVAECWYLMQNRKMTRGTKILVSVAALLVVVGFWGLLSSYIDLYNSTGSGDQAETLTGRTFIWAVAFSMGLERPWFGHGIYSFKALVPAFGDFQAVHAHNELLQQFFEYGVAGVAIVVGIYWSFFRQARRAPPSDLRTLALTLLLFALLRGLADTANFGLSYPLWLLAALSICLFQSAGEEARRP